MFLDLRDIHQSLIESELCIIGSGPAGLSIALEFANTEVRVCVLESGGLKISEETQALAQGEVVGLPYWLPLKAARYRHFGGSTSKWGAWLAPLNEIDFSSREWIPYSGWPISYADLQPYYDRAQALCGVPTYTYDPRRAGYEPDALLPIADDGLVHRLWQFGVRAGFGTMYRRRIRLAENIRVILHANVTSLETDDSETLIHSAMISSLEGKKSEVRAKVFVLAVGGLEAPRVLLLSRTKDGTALGNRNGVVGRFFMEHPHIFIGKAALRGDRSWVKTYQMRRVGRNVIRPHFCVSEEKQRELQLINCSCSVDFIDEEVTGYNALRRLKKTVMDPYENKSTMRDLACIVANPLDVAFGLYSKLSNSRYIPHRPIPLEVALRVRSEQIPNPESRVTLSEKRDGLGLNQIRLDWRMGGAEKRSMRLMAQVLQFEFERLGLGEVHSSGWLESDDEEWPADLIGGPHHMGTTRMSDDPRRGVVDHNCRVHDLRNLFVAGSSVFPTSGYANPTLTLIALAVRLADHLKRDLLSTPTLIG